MFGGTHNISFKKLILCTSHISSQEWFIVRRYLSDFIILLLFFCSFHVCKSGGVPRHISLPMSLCEVLQAFLVITVSSFPPDALPCWVLCLLHLHIHYMLCFSMTATLSWLNCVYVLTLFYSSMCFMTISYTMVIEEMEWQLRTIQIDLIVSLPQHATWSYDTNKGYRRKLPLPLTNCREPGSPSHPSCREPSTAAAQTRESDTATLSNTIYQSCETCS